MFRHREAGPPLTQGRPSESRSLESKNHDKDTCRKGAECVNPTNSVSQDEENVGPYTENPGVLPRDSAIYASNDA